MFPIRLSIITYNLFDKNLWLQRRSALKHFVKTFNPDILCIQELCQETQSFLDYTLSSYSRVYDTFSGWTCEGNIYWNSKLLEEIEHGIHNVGMIEKDRRLFWVRLAIKNTNKTILVNTIHLTFRGNAHEIKTGQSPRLKQTRQAIKAIKQNTKENEPVFFAGDFNDASHPAYILLESGYQDCFSALNIQAPPTSPKKEVFSSQTMDWIFAKNARCILAQVPHFTSDGIMPSDHYPVIAIYEI